MRLLSKKGLFLSCILALFVFLSICVPQVEAKQSCSCKPIWGNGMFKPVTGYDITNNCDSGFEPEWGMDIGGYSGCNCTCKPSGTAKSMPVNPNIPVTGLNNPQPSSNNPFGGCQGPTSNSPEINTALGCIPVKMQDFIPWLLRYLFGIAGGIAFLLMVYGFILIGTSSGDEKKVQGAKETITSAITGLLVSVFGLFILNLIANNILKLPGF